MIDIVWKKKRLKARLKIKYGKTFLKDTQHNARWYIHLSAIVLKPMVNVWFSIWNGDEKVRRVYDSQTCTKQSFKWETNELRPSRVRAVNQSTISNPSYKWVTRVQAETLIVVRDSRLNRSVETQFSLLRHSNGLKSINNSCIRVLSVLITRVVFRKIRNNSSATRPYIGNVMFRKPTLLSFRENSERIFLSHSQFVTTIRLCV